MDAKFPQPPQTPPKSRRIAPAQHHRNSEVRYKRWTFPTSDSKIIFNRDAFARHHGSIARHCGDHRRLHAVPTTPRSAESYRHGGGGKLWTSSYCCKLRICPGFAATAATDNILLWIAYLLIARCYPPRPPSPGAISPRTSTSSRCKSASSVTPAGTRGTVSTG